MSGWFAKWRKDRLMKKLNLARGDLAAVSQSVKLISRNDLNEGFLDHQMRRLVDLKVLVHFMECKLQDLS